MSRIGKQPIAVPGGVTVLWPRIIPRDIVDENRDLGAALQQQMKILVEKHLPGRAIDFRPEPERVCPKTGCTGVSVGLLLALGLWLRQRQPNALWYQHLSANTYALVLCAAGYAAGSLNFASGVVLMGAPMVGFILMEPQVVKRAFAIALLAMVGFGLASAYGWLPYAPIMQPPSPSASAASSRFWHAGYTDPPAYGLGSR